jgi:hypothetical protein
VIGIAHHQPKRMLAWRQIDRRLGLAGAEMKVILVQGDRLLGVGKLIDVDQVKAGRI